MPNNILRISGAIQPIGRAAMGSSGGGSERPVWCVGWRYQRLFKHVPYILPDCLKHTELGPQSVSNAQVLPYVLSRSKGALTGCWSLRLPGKRPPTQTPEIIPLSFKHLLPGIQSVSNEQAKLTEGARKTRTRSA